MENRLFKYERFQRRAFQFPFWNHGQQWYTRGLDERCKINYIPQLTRKTKLAVDYTYVNLVTNRFLRYSSTGNWITIRLSINEKRFVQPQNIFTPDGVYCAYIFQFFNFINKYPVEQWPQYRVGQLFHYVGLYVMCVGMMFEIEYNKVYFFEFYTWRAHNDYMIEMLMK